MSKNKTKLKKEIAKLSLADLCLLNASGTLRINKKLYAVQPKKGMNDFIGKIHPEPARVNISDKS